MRKRFLGGIEVSAIGFGALPLSIEGRPERAQAMDTIDAAINAGITLIDTSNAYTLPGGPVGHNELLVAEALRRHPRTKIFVATKGGLVRAGNGEFVPDAQPKSLRRACEASLRALGIQTIDLYQLHRPDPRVPLADSVGELSQLRDEGKIRLVGLSNVGIAHLAEATTITSIASVQNRFSPHHRESTRVLSWCAEHDVAFLAWSPLGGIGAAAKAADLFPNFATVASRLQVSTQQVVLAWELAQSEAMIPIPGASRPATIVDSSYAMSLALSAEDLQMLDVDPHGNSADGSQE